LIAGNRLFQSKGFHDDKKEYSVFKAADAVWLGYDKRFQGSSGVMIQAACIGCPVLSSSYGLIGQLTEQYSLGITFDPDDISQISTAIIKLFSGSSLRQKFQENGLLFAKKYSSDNFQKSLIKIVIESMK
jgi:glycosyltransferase involved in cell wall biosynthesis